MMSTAETAIANQLLPATFWLIKYCCNLFLMPDCSVIISGNAANGTVLPTSVFGWTIIRSELPTIFLGRQYRPLFQHFLKQLPLANGLGGQYRLAIGQWWQFLWQ